MADSDITNLPEVILPAAGDNLVIDDISDGVATRTKRITASNFLNNFLALIGVSAIKVNSVSSVSGGIGVTIADNVIISKPAANTTISLVGNANGTFYNLATDIAGDLVIDAIHNLSAKPLRIASLAPNGSATLKSSGKLNIPFGLETNSIEANSDAPINIINSYFEQNIALSTQGGSITLDGFPFKGGHVDGGGRALFQPVTVSRTTFYAVLVGLNFPVGQPIPVTGTVWSERAGAVNETNIDTAYMLYDGNAFTFFGGRKEIAVNGSWAVSRAGSTSILNSDTPFGFQWALCFL